jgi:hypothetical protein
LGEPVRRRPTDPGARAGHHDYVSTVHVSTVHVSTVHIASVSLAQPGRRLVARADAGRTSGRSAFTGFPQWCVTNVADRTCSAASVLAELVRTSP